MMVIGLAVLSIGLVIAVAFVPDGPQYFTGRVVGKQYIEEHMCHDSEDSYRTVTYSVIAPHTTPVHVPAAPHVHHHKLQPAEYIVWIANRHEVIQRHVSRTFFKSVYCGKRITVKL